MYINNINLCFWEGESINFEVSDSKETMKLLLKQFSTSTVEEKLDQKTMTSNLCYKLNDNFLISLIDFVTLNVFKLSESLFSSPHAICKSISFQSRYIVCFSVQDVEPEVSCLVGSSHNIQLHNYLWKLREKFISSANHISENHSILYMQKIKNTH